MILIVTTSVMAINLISQYNNRKIKQQEEIMKRRDLNQIKRLQNKTSYTKPI